jgi:hypothetical protein
VKRQVKPGHNTTAGINVAKREPAVVPRLMPYGIIGTPRVGLGIQFRRSPSPLLMLTNIIYDHFFTEQRNLQPEFIYSDNSGWIFTL